MDERDEQKAKAEERVEDLDVPEEESDEVKGGLNFSKIEFQSRIDKTGLTDLGSGPGGGA